MIRLRNVDILEHCFTDILHDKEGQDDENTECHIVEGSNGISTPIDEKLTEADVVKALGLPLILVVNAEKNSIDEVIYGINYIYSKNVKFMGVIVNSFDKESENIEKKYYPELIQQYTGAKIIGCMRKYGTGNLNAQTLIADTLSGFNLEEIFGIKIAKLQ